jgi:uncharacterized membrane protein
MDVDPGRRATEPDTESPSFRASLTGEVIRDQDRLLLVFAYLGPLSLVPLFGSRDPFVRWHARQGSGLTLLLAAGLVVLSPFDWLFGLVPILGRLFRACELFLALGYLAVVAVAIERAVSGGRFRIPWLSDLADQE